MEENLVNKSYIRNNLFATVLFLVSIPSFVWAQSNFDMCAKWINQNINFKSDDKKNLVTFKDDGTVKLSLKASHDGDYIKGPENKNMRKFYDPSDNTNWPGRKNPDKSYLDYKDMYNKLKITKNAQNKIEKIEVRSIKGMSVINGVFFDHAFETRTYYFDYNENGNCRPKELRSYRHVKNIKGEESVQANYKICKEFYDIYTVMPYYTCGEGEFNNETKCKATSGCIWKSNSKCISKYKKNKDGILRKQIVLPPRSQHLSLLVPLIEKMHNYSDKVKENLRNMTTKITLDLKEKKLLKTVFTSAEQYCFGFHPNGDNFTSHNLMAFFELDSINQTSNVNENALLDEAQEK